MADTKERILLTALRLFAINGYEAVSVSDIAGALGVTKGALYRHYQSKRDIFDSILSRMAQRDAEQAREYHLPEGTPIEMKEAYTAAPVEQIAAFSKAMFRYWTQDSFAAPFRRMLTLEQYRSAEMNGLYQQYLVSGPLGYLTDLFCSMGLAMPREKAAAFYAPMFLLYSVCDGGEDPQNAEALLDRCIESARASFADSIPQKKP
jgi:AcrR family transcriptional regulator